MRAWSAAARRAAGAVPRAARRGRRAGSPPSTATHACVNGFSARLDPTSARVARSRSRGRGRLPGADRLSSAGRRVGRWRAARRRSPISRSRVSTAPASRSRCSTRASIRPIPYLRSRVALGRRRHRPRQRRSRAAAPDDSWSAGAARNRARRDHRRHRGPGRAARDRARAPRSSRSASVAGSRTRRGATASTRARIRSSPGSRRPSIPTTTATCSTPRASPSSGWSSRTRRSRTARCRARSPGRQISTCSRSSPPGTTGRQGPATGASPVPAARSTPSPWAPRTAASRRRRFACSCAPASVSSTRTTSRSVAPRRRP